MQTFVISLQRTPGRLQAFRERNGGHPQIEVFHAIDGAAFASGRPVPADVANPGVRYAPGALGCAMSHRELWKRAASCDEPIMICEDDAVLHREFARASRDVLDFLGDHWDLMLWGWNFDAPLIADLLPELSPCGMQFNQSRMRTNWRTYVDAPIRASPLRLRSAFGIPCYSISPTGARRFLAACFPLRDFAWTVPGFGNTVENYGIDVAMCPAYQDTASFLCFPPLAVTENDRSTSTIQGP